MAIRKGKSKCKNCSATVTGCRVMVRPMTPKMLKRLLPRMLPRAISVCLRQAATTAVMSSGEEPPKATNVVPMAASEMPMVRARFDAPVIMMSEPKTSMASPATR